MNAIQDWRNFSQRFGTSHFDAFNVYFANEHKLGLSSEKYKFLYRKNVFTKFHKENFNHSPNLDSKNRNQNVVLSPNTNILDRIVLHPICNIRIEGYYQRNNIWPSEIPSSNHFLYKHIAQTIFSYFALCQYIN